MIDMLRRLFKLPLPDLAAVEFGVGHELCEVQYDCEGRPYVWILGNCFLLDDQAKKGRQVIWIRRAPR